MRSSWWGGRWIGHWRTTWSMVCSSAPHSLATEEATLHLYKQERKRPTPVLRRLSRTQALLGKFAPGVLYRCRGLKCGVLRVCLPTPHSIGNPPSAPHVCCLLSDEQMSCCAAGTNGYLDLRRRASALDRRVSAEWSRCPGSMARRAKDNVAPLRRSSASWMPARIGVLDGGVDEAGMSTEAPDRSAVLCGWMHQGSGG